MRRVFILMLAVAASFGTMAAGLDSLTVSCPELVRLEERGLTNTTRYPFAPKGKPRHWLALGEEVAFFGFTTAMARLFAPDDPDVHPTGEDIKNNFKTGFMWDNDNFPTNMVDHFYQGAQMHNLARSCNMNFWQTIPYALFGTLVWEFVGESQPPSINDMFTTVLGGVATGEMMWRISSICLRSDHRALGEIAAFIISPMRGVNRLCGKMWKPQKVDEEGMFPFSLNLTLGGRTEFGRIAGSTVFIPALNIRMRYGDLFDYGVEKPFEYFTLDFELLIGKSSQPMMGAINSEMAMWGRESESEKGNRTYWGVYENFNYWNYGTNIKDVGVPAEDPYRVCEGVSYGMGVTQEIKLGGKSWFTWKAKASGVLMGAISTDQYFVIKRDYNFGSGWSAHTGIGLKSDRIDISAACDYMGLYTWKGWDPNRIVDDPNYTNAQGDKGSAYSIVSKAKMAVRIWNQLRFAVEYSYYFRHSNYELYPSVRHTFQDLSMSLGYTF